MTHESEEHPAFSADYEIFWRHYRSPAEELAELCTINTLARLEPGTRVLDLACGFGRLASPLAAQGCDVLGVDSSPALLEVAKREAGPRTAFLLADMRTFDGAGAFDVVLIWSTVLGYYEEVDDERLLATARDALRPGGLLLLETRHWDSLERTFDRYTERRRGADVLREWHDYDPVCGRQLTRQQVTVGEVVRERSYHVRRYGVPELRAMLVRSGFIDVTAHDGAGRALRPTSSRAVVRAVRPVEP